MKETLDPADPTLVHIRIGDINVEGDLRIPADARGMVLFAHGSGSSRKSVRNRFVADVLNRHRLGTLLLDLLTPEEERADARTGHLRFDIPFLADRLSVAAGWLGQSAQTRHLAVGCFGASTGGGAALVAAAQRPATIHAVVSRGGRPDLAGTWLGQVRAPTLLIVGGCDETVLQLNREALTKLGCEKRLEIIPGATHLFEEPGALEKVADLASEWFGRTLP